MEWLKGLLFEDPLKLYLVLGVVEVALVAFWYSRRTAGWALSLLGPVAVGGAVAVTAALVVTDRERITSALEAIAAAAEARDLLSAAGHLDPGCEGVRPGGRPLTREELIVVGQAALARHPIARIRAGDVDTQIAGANATTTLRTRVTFTTGEQFTLRWKVQWARRPAGWRIVAVELLAPRMLSDYTF